MTLLRRGLISLLALAVGPIAQAAAVASPAAAVPRLAGPQSLAEETGLTVSVDVIDPSVLVPGESLELSGVVRNDSDRIWGDAQVYLEISQFPATTKGELDDFSLTGDEKFGERIVDIGLFDEIGAVKAGQSEPYRLSIPFAQLPITGGPGVYHIAVAVLASQAGVRDANADARTDALLPVEDPDTPPPQQTSVTTLIPVTAPVPRQIDGAFAGDGLAAEVSLGGRLRNLLDFVLAAPSHSIDLVVDPDVINALQAMSDGYEVVRLADGANATPRAGEGDDEAADWLSDFDTAATLQSVDLLPWANTNTSGLVAAGMSGVADAALRASAQFASESPWQPAPVVDWQSNGVSTRRALTVTRRAGATLHVVSQSTLTRLEPEDDNGYPPALATVRTRTVPLTVTVTRSDLAGEPFTAATSALEFRQGMLAEALIRAMSSTPSPALVVAAPFRWNPRFVPPDLNLASVYNSNVVMPMPLDTLNFNSALAPDPIAYQGPVEVTEPHPEMTSGLEDAVKRLRRAGRVYTELLTDGREAAAAFDRQLAEAGSSVWLWKPNRGEALIRRSARAMSSQTRKVTVTGPEFVAMSSEAGRFPLTVNNGLDVSVTVKVAVVPRNPALRIDPIEPIELDAGQTRVIEVQSRSAGSGVTSVRAQLATAEDRRFGRVWSFDIRATRIGVAIWILLGVLIATLLSGAALSIMRRIRGGSFRPRGQRPA